MSKSPFTLFYSLLLPVLLLGFAQGLWAEDSAAEASEANSENALNRLIEISAQLSVLNERLHSELQDSRRNSSQLQSMLEESKRELEELRRELKDLQNNSTELSERAENSLTEFTALEAALKKAESSLMSLEFSFEAYRLTAEKRINVLERQNKAWKWGFTAAGVLAAGFATAFLVGQR